MLIKKFQKTGNSNSILFDQVLLDLVHADPDTNIAIIPDGRGYYILPLTEENKDIGTPIQINIPVNLVKKAFIKLDEEQNNEN
jgi:hypothetical protein